MRRCSVVARECERAFVNFVSILRSNAYVACASSYQVNSIFGFPKCPQGTKQWVKAISLRRLIMGEPKPFVL